jgi:glucose-6-phosphate 1-dehydrogenase
MSTSQSDALVFFGATGDLAFRKIFPALQALVKRGHLDVPVIGVGRSAWTANQLRARVRESLETHGRVDPVACEKLCGLLRYVRVDYADPTTFQALRKELGGAERPAHHLAIAPHMFETVVEQLVNSGCAKGARILVEKPFGRDLASAQKLNRILLTTFDESAIFHIDHYLGKEPVQNLIYFRFANPFIEAGWNRHSIRSVQITMAEQFGMAGRGRFYEEVGAIRDVVQNHLLMVIACLAMEEPSGRDHESIRKERVKVLKMIRPLLPSDVVRGQFRGYRCESGVAPDSQVETFAALRLYIDSERWAGVPFYVRTGKCLPVTATEVLAEFTRPCSPVLDEVEPPLPNYVRFRLSSDVMIALGSNTKIPGEAMVGERIELVARHGSGDEMDPYERLLGDAMKGDAMLFVRADGVEAAWRIVEPVLHHGKPLYTYEPGSWGPKEADDLLDHDRGWHNPTIRRAQYFNTNSTC